MDNFRGFKDTYLPIKDVNFLVGENSTGKSSVLGLISLLNDPRFWYESVFNTEDVQFGHFDDIVSIFSDDRKAFTIGVIHYNEYRGNNGATSIMSKAHKLTFIEKEGQPILKDYFHYDGQIEFHATLDNQKNVYKCLIEDAIPLNGAKKIISKYFKKWGQFENAKVKPYVDIDLSKYSIMDRNVGSSPQDILFAVGMEYREKLKDKQKLSRFISIDMKNLVWIAPIRTKPKRTYDEYKYEYTPEGEHIPYVIKRILKDKKGKEKFLKFARKIGQDSGLFSDIVIKSYGKTATSPFELDILLNRKALGVSNVGYGVSQALPFIVEMFTRGKGTTISIQQPEVHLHPKAQAALGTAIYELASTDSKKFIIETHSDYMIDRFRIDMRNAKYKRKVSSQIVFFERNLSGNKLKILEIDETGEIHTQLPKGYREFFLKEKMDLLGL